MTRSALSIEKLDAPLGAVIEGADLRMPLESGELEAVRSALFEHQVLFFRGQALDDDQHIRFAEQFGTPCIYPLVEMLGGNKPLEMVVDGGDRKPVAGNWHTDVTWLQDPPKLGVLSARVMPDEGGDTLWCNLYGVYDSLPEDLRRKLEGLVVAHSPGQGFYDNVVAPLGGDDFVERFKARYGDGSRHDLIRDHYVTGRRLVYLAGGFMDHIEDMDVSEGRALLREVMEIASDATLGVRWKWQVDDLAIWDERSTMHRVDASHWPEHRVMRRCTIG